MNSGATFERVYDALKARILANEFRPGERLDPARLGNELNTSPTPVRDALHLLSGEGLVETRLSDGFHIAMIDAPALQDLYAWTAEVLLLALRSWPRSASRATVSLSPAEPAPDVPALFVEIATRSENGEHSRAIRSLNDRLHAARMCEPLVLPDIEDEFASMRVLLDQHDRRALRRAIIVYHRRRHRLAHELVRALYRQA